jgi:hypothetical protein
MKRAVLLSMLLVPGGLAAQGMVTEMPRTLTVSGQGTVERAPDQAMLVLAVESEASNARDAARNNARKMERVIEAVRKAGIPAERIRTVGYDLGPVYARQEQGDQPPRIAGYRALNRVQVTIEALDRVGPALDAAIDAGANRAENLYYQLKDPSAARLEALRLATAKARAEAEAIAAAAGERLGPAQSISTDGYMPPPRPMDMYARGVEAVAMDMKTPVEAGTLSVSANITIVYRLGN